MGNRFCSAGRGWESGHTYNPAAVRLGPGDSAIIRRLLEGRPAPREGVVAILYRAQPRQSHGFRAPRSSIGLAVFTTELDLLRRFPDPVIRPTEDPEGCDYDGAEDPRVTRMVTPSTWSLRLHGTSLGARMRVCLAQSRDRSTGRSVRAGAVNHGPIRWHPPARSHRRAPLSASPPNGVASHPTSAWNWR